MLEEFTGWFLDLVISAFKYAITWFGDAVLTVASALLSAVIGLISAIPVPAFLSQGIQSFYANMDPGVIWFLNQFGIPYCFGIIGTAYGFRLLRKVVTLFQW